LAVIEHLNDPVDFLHTLSKILLDDGRLVITTPHPSVEWIHSVGATIGFFSKHANEEHENLLDRGMLEKFGTQAGLKLEFYSRFLLGANQVAVYSKLVARALKLQEAQKKMEL
jgi:hypothetical protein